MIRHPTMRRGSNMKFATDVSSHFYKIVCVYEGRVGEGSLGPQSLSQIDAPWLGFYELIGFLVCSR